MRPFSSPKNQRLFPAALTHYLTWLMMAAAVAAAAVLLAAPGVVWGQVNTAPTFDAGDSLTLTVDENTVAGGAVGEPLAVTDADDDDTLTFLFYGTNVGSFEIDPNGQIKVGTGTDLDFESSKTSYTVGVTVHDGKAADGTDDPTVDDTIAITINVVDVNEPPPAPSAPTITAPATNRHNTLDVSWTALVTTGIPPISGYDIQSQKNSELWTLASFDATTTNTTLTELDPLTTYNIQVRALNDEGMSDWSTSSSSTTSAAPLTFGTATIDPLNFTVGKAIDTVTLPEATGGTGDITYSLTTTLPNGLLFTPATREITGTPNTESVSAEHTYTATDSATPSVPIPLKFTIAVVANQPPTADAGPDQNVGEGDTVMLDGSGSSDLDGETLTYEWTQTPGTIVQLNDRTSVRPTFIAPAVNETLTFSLQVTDSQSQNSADTVDITVAAVPVCTTATVQQSKAVPSATFDLTFAFAGNCRPADFTDATFTVLLHEDIGVPTGFGKDHIYVHTTEGSFVPNYVFKRSDDDGDEEIEIAGCGQWRHIGASSNSANTRCAAVGSLRSIQLRGLTLPSRPASAAEEDYVVSIQWGSNAPFSETIDVGATLEIEGDKLVGFGESIKFKGSGFSYGVTANLYAQPGTGSEVCTNAGGGSWTNIGSTNVGSDHRFESDVEISTTAFRSAGKYLVCAVDGAGVPSANALIIEIKVGLKVVGAGSGIEFQPGQEIALSIEGGGSNLGIESILVAGQVAGPW